MGMPGETLSSYKIGLEQLMELFPRPVVFIYNCGVFPNAPMNEPAYKEFHKIKTKRSPMYTSHVIIPKNDKFFYFMLRTVLFSYGLVWLVCFVFV